MDSCFLFTEVEIECREIAEMSIEFYFLFQLFHFHQHRQHFLQVTLDILLSLEFLQQSQQFIFFFEGKTCMKASL